MASEPQISVRSYIIPSTDAPSVDKHTRPALNPYLVLGGGAQYLLIFSFSCKTSTNKIVIYFGNNYFNLSHKSLSRILKRTRLRELTLNEVLVFKMRNMCIS